MIEVKNRYTGKTILSIESLVGADLRRADLRRADLEAANLEAAILRGASLRRADLRRANLWGADLEAAILRGANLEAAILRRADLRGADLRYARLRNVIGDGVSIVSLCLTPWPVAMSRDSMAIGCESHSVKEWNEFTSRQIADMDYAALEWWTKWKPILMSIHSTHFGERNED